MNYPIYKVWRGTGTCGRITAKFTGKESGIRLWSEKNQRDGVDKEEHDEMTPWDCPDWRDPETIEEWLLCLPTEYGELAVQRYKETGKNREGRINDFLKREDKTPEQAVMDAIHWFETPEKSDFWQSVYAGESPAIPKTETKKEIMKTTRLSVDSNEFLQDLCLKLLEQKGYNVRGTMRRFSPQYPVLCIYLSGYNGDLTEVFHHSGHPVSFSYVKCTIAEVISFIEGLPTITTKKPLTIGSLDSETPIILDDDEVKIGCQTIMAKDFEILIKKVNAYREHVERIQATPSYAIVANQRGIEVPDMDVKLTYSEFDGIVEAFKQYHK